MSEIPPPQFASYPRDAAALDPEAADRLQALWAGYMGLSWVFVANIFLAVGERLSFAADNLLIPVAAVLLVIFLIAALTYPFNKKIGYGLRWSPSGPIIASVLMGINSALCCGIIGYVVMQSLAAKGIAAAGVRRRWHGGFTKKDVLARIAQLRAG